MMLRCDTIAHVRSEVAHAKAHGASIGFVPTMGNLHAGHLSLVRAAKAKTDFVVVSIFVNPAQFGPQEDFTHYPRTLVEDCAALADIQTSAVFHPPVNEIYAQPCLMQVTAPELANTLCGASRPGHFDGVGLVVAKLFHIVQPDHAFFGLKDYQQCLLIQRLVQDLNFPLSVHLEPTTRAADGLAMSSRNHNLSKQQRATAPKLYATLLSLKNVLLAGDRAYAEMQQAAAQRLSAAGFDVDYVQIRRPDNLQPSGPGDQAWQVLVAVKLGPTRLIDNLRVEVIKQAT